MHKSSIRICNRTQNKYAREAYRHAKESHINMQKSPVYICKRALHVYATEDYTYMQQRPID